MPAYMVAQIDIRDRDAFQRYLDGFMPSFERHGGELLATSRFDTEVIEGEWALPRTVIMRFPTAEDARAWHENPEYRALAEHRHRAAQTNLVLVSPPA